MITIDETNYELWLVRYSDGSLTADEREAVEHWLEGHPEAEAELQMYADAPRLERDETVSYGGAIPGRKVIPLWPTLRWTAAAAAVAAIVLSVVLLPNSNTLPEGVATVDVPTVLHEELPATQEVAEQPAATPKVMHNTPKVAVVQEEPQPPTVPQPQSQAPIVEAETYHPANSLPQVPVYVEDLIVFADEPEEEPVALVAQANIETYDNGISMPRLVGALLKAGINR